MITYQTLTAQIQAYLNRDDAFVLAQIPNFINQGINRIYSEVKTINTQEVFIDKFTIGVNTFGKPQDWKQTISFQFVIPGVTPYADFLEPVSYEYARLYWRNPILTGVPKFYSELSEDFIFISPTPDSAYDIIFTYLTVPTLSANNPENFLTRKYPSLLLYASLIEAQQYLKNVELLPQWEASYARALQDIKTDTKDHYTDRVVKRDVN